MDEPSRILVADDHQVVRDGVRTALSERELQVLRLLAEGHGVGEIAEKLSLSPKTISTYRSRLLEKMDMASDAELIRYAIERDLVR